MENIKFLAHIPATSRSSGGKVFKTAPHFVLCERGDQGKWTITFSVAGHQVTTPITEDDLIDKIKKASNWKEIMIEHFPMHGFHS